MKGFKCGLEIHQRLSSGSKLFCRCSDVPVGPGVAPSGSLRRRLQAVVGETGKEDRAAVFEQSRGREFVYQLFDDHSCLIDVDEQPPFPINQDALDTVLSISLLLNCTCVDELVVMRKTVVDGSSPSAFQRTALVATGGFLETSRGKVGIQTVCIEE
ncbi:MAG: Glu-tRNA(Gln) amidotransferase GatDE subunit E, partial [Candidatus Micrarchaeia archaeon]